MGCTVPLGIREAADAALEPVAGLAAPKGQVAASAEAEALGQVLAQAGVAASAGALEQAEVRAAVVELAQARGWAGILSVGARARPLR